MGIKNIIQEDIKFPLPILDEFSTKTDWKAEDTDRAAIFIDGYGWGHGNGNGFGYNDGHGNGRGHGSGEGYTDGLGLTFGPNYLMGDIYK